MEVRPAIVSELWVIWSIGWGFYALVYPWWAIGHCLNSSRTNKSKASWIVPPVLFWVFGAIIYGAFGSNDRLHRTMAAISPIFLPPFSILFVSAVTEKRFPEEVSEWKDVFFGDRKRLAKEKWQEEQ